VASDDPGMRPAIGSTRTWLSYDRNAWTEADLAVGDIVTVYSEYGQNGQDSRAFPFRVVAVGGDWIKIEGGSVARFQDAADKQGKPENYQGAELRPYPNMAVVPKFQVPRGYVYLLTDNRLNAAVGGPGLVPVSRVIGKIQI
jgi:hypothetical protein